MSQHQDVTLLNEDSTKFNDKRHVGMGSGNAHDKC